MDLEQDHPAIGWGHWTAQFESASRLQAVVKAIFVPMQGLQQAQQGLYAQRWLDTAEGAQLDGIGQIVGLSRVLAHQWHPGGATTLDDAAYRRLLYWKIAVNNGRGTAAEIVAALRLIFEVPRVIVEDAGTAKIRIWIAQPPDARNPLLATPARWVPKAAGVGIWAMTTSPDHPFGFSNQHFYGFGVGVMAHSI